MAKTTEAKERPKPPGPKPKPMMDLRTFFTLDTECRDKVHAYTRAALLVQCKGDVKTKSEWAAEMKQHQM